jgi:hypothetical protein
LLLQVQVLLLVEVPGLPVQQEPWILQLLELHLRHGRWVALLQQLEQGPCLLMLLLVQL